MLTPAENHDRPRGGRAGLGADPDLALATTPGDPAGSDPAAEVLHVARGSTLGGRGFDPHLPACWHGHGVSRLGSFLAEAGKARDDVGIARVGQGEGGVPVGPTPVGAEPGSARGFARLRLGGRLRAESIEAHRPEHDHAQQDQREHALAPRPHRATGFLVITAPRSRPGPGAAPGSWPGTAPRRSPRPAPPRVRNDVAHPKARRGSRSEPSSCHDPWNSVEM